MNLWAVRSILPGVDRAVDFGVDGQGRGVVRTDSDSPYPTVLALICGLIQDGFVGKGGTDEAYPPAGQCVGASGVQQGNRLTDADGCRKKFVDFGFHDRMVGIGNPT